MAVLYSEPLMNLRLGPAEIESTSAATLVRAMH